MLQKLVQLERLQIALRGNVEGFGFDVVCKAWTHIHLYVTFSINAALCSVPLQEALISEHLVIFVVSTTGWGAEPRAMTSLWNMLLRSDLPDDLFEDMFFCVFGLGDTAYEKFCWPAKKLSRRMQSLGGYEICPRGEGDEQHRLGWVSSSFFPAFPGG